MKKLIIICLLALTYTNTYSQYDETYSNDWGSWENCNDFKGINFRIKSNYVKGEKFKFVDIQFKNDYQNGVYFYFFAKDLLGTKNNINNQLDWQIMMLNKGETQETKSVRLNFDDETLDIYIGGVLFSKTNKAEWPNLKSKFSHTYPEINNDFGEKTLCLYCTLFEDNKLYCPQGKAADISNSWSANGTAALGQKITRAEADAKKTEMDKFVKSPTGMAIVVGASAVVITKALSDVGKLHKEYKKEEEQYIKDNIESFKKDKNESDESAFTREIRDNKRKKMGGIFVKIIGGAIGAGLGLLLLSNSK